MICGAAETRNLCLNIVRLGNDKATEEIVAMAKAL